ncbi:hypothetical protein SKAU_G00083370 [Synaphobranchus kaupii]|uniref:Synaptotagmin-like protein 2 n=1 Tax=Synaphobranchus kaupii TaxID=118154 RepID=A0A9Q1FVS5_SYNKA|nr:hypothetical protein SKAU_G00083370 [Synaphobranchus kaupii]
MIDLSYLTEEEQEMIMSVLQRDAELKRAEDTRVKHMQRLPPDRGKLKYMTGEWFYEAKSQRHMDRIHGSDIIRASMKQQNLLNLTQSWTARTRAVSNGNEDTVFPPEPLGQNQEPPKQPKEERESDNASPDAQQERLRPVVRSPAKRHNPFNRASLLLLETPGETDSQLTNGAMELHETNAGEPLSPLKSDIAGLTDDLSSEGPGALQEMHTEHAPVPKKRTILFSPLDSLFDNDSPFSRWGNWRGSHSRLVTPRGILKQSTSWSSNDSGLPYEGAGKRPELSGDHPSGSFVVAPERESTEEGGEDKGLDDSLYGKQVRFSLRAAARGPQLWEGREFGDQDLLDLDHPTLLDEERGEGVPGTGHERDDGNSDLSLALCRTACDQPPEEEGCSSAASGTLKDSPHALLLSNESKFSWMAHTKFSPWKSIPPPVPESQPHKWAGSRAEAGTGEAMAKPAEVALRWEDVVPPQIPVGQYETQEESNPPQVSSLLLAMDEKGKPVYGGMGSLEAPPMTEVQSREFTEGDSIAKVLEWFSRSSDSSDYQEEHICQQDVDVETRAQPGAPEDDITKYKMVEDKDQSMVPKDDFTAIGQMAECTLIGSPIGEMQVPHLKRAQLEESAKVEEKDIACVEGTDKIQSPVEPERMCPKSVKECPVILQYPAHSSLNTESACQPKLQMSTFDTRPQSLKKENAIDIEEEHDREADVILLSPVTKATKQDLKQSEARNERLPQIIANLKSFWEKGSSGPKILISRSSATSKHNQIETEPDRTKVCKAGQEVPPEETCLDTKDGKNNHHLAQDTCNQGKSVDMEDGVGEPSVQSVVPLTQEDSLKRPRNHHREAEVGLAPVCAKNALPIESSHLVESLEEEKYIAKCVVIDEDAEVPISPVEKEKADFQKFPQKEELSSGIAPLSRHVSSFAEQPSFAPTVNQSPNQLDSSADKIGNLKAFWESEKHGPTTITDKPKGEVADTKESPFPAHPAVVNKTFAKSAFDLRTMGTDIDDSDSPLKQGPNFTVLSMKQRMENASMSQSPSNLQFKNLRDFWGGTPSNRQNPQLTSTEKITVSPKGPQLIGLKTSLNPLEKSLSPTGDNKPYLNPNYPRLLSKDLEMANFGAQKVEKYNLKTYTIDMSSPKNESKEKKQLSPTTLPRQDSGSSDEVKVAGSSGISPLKESKRSQSQQWPAGQEQQNPPLYPCPGRHSEQASFIEDSRAFRAQRDSQRHRRTSSGKATGRVNPLRRTASMYVGNPSDEQQDSSSEHLRNRQEGPLAGRQTPYREAPEKQPSGTSNGGERPQPLARSFVPRDYQHYLGLPEGATFQSMPDSKKEEEETSSCFPQEMELGVASGPVRSSTPVVSEEPQARRGSDGQYSWHPHHGPDAVDLDSYRSSTCETWSCSGTSSACDDEDTHPVRKALKRAALRPVSSAKSVEDITVLPTREERSKNKTRCELMLSMDDVSVKQPSPPSFISDPTQMKNMSKSVPAFLQKESSTRDSDSTSESSVHTGRQARMGSSLTNLSSSSGMSSVSGSVMSVYSGDFGNVEVRGTIQFSINYVQKLLEFHIFVVQCRDLAAVDTEKNRSNPYVKCYLLPDYAKLGKRKTSVKKKTLNPNFNEILRYRVRLETLKTQLLNLSVWHNDTFGRNSFLGEIEVDLSKWDFGNTQMNHLTLKRKMQSGFQGSDQRGEMRLALRFLPQMSYSNKLSNTGEVHIWVKDCKDLPIIRGTSINPSVKCFVLPDTSRKSRQKTRILKRTQTPAFNHTMVYDGFKAEDLREACVELTVWDHDHLASHFVGGLRLGLGTGKSYGAVVGWMDSSTDEANLWERMMDSPNEWVEDVLSLRMLTMAKDLWN